MLSSFVFLLALLHLTFGDDCKGTECQFQFYQKFGYSSTGCFADVETFIIDDTPYIAYCEDVDENTEEAARILRYNSATKKYESFQRITVSGNCHDIAFFQDEDDDDLNFLFICGDNSNINYYEWQGNTDGFASQATITKDIDTLGSCSVEKIYGNNGEYTVYFVENGYVEDASPNPASEILFYEYDSTNGEFPLNFAEVVTKEWEQLGRLSFQTENDITYMFEAVTLKTDVVTNAYRDNSSLWQIDSKDPTKLSLELKATYETRGASSSAWISVPSHGESRTHLAVANQQSSASVFDESVSISIINETIIENLNIPNTIHLNLFQSIETKNALSINSFIINNNAYIGIGQSEDDRDGSNIALYAIYEYDIDFGYFIPFQTITIKNAEEIQWASAFEDDDGEWFLVLAPCFGDDASNSGIYIYSWSDERVTTTEVPDIGTNVTGIDAMVIAIIACIVGMFI